MLSPSGTSKPDARLSSEPLEDRLDEFLSLSRDLLSIVEHENAILLEEGELSFEAYILRKVGLMNRFESEARNLLGALAKEQESSSMQSILIEEISRIRNALTINSSFQMRAMIKHRQEKFAEHGETKSLVSGEGKCH